MKGFERMINRASNNMVFISGVLLCFIMGVSITDVIMRNLGKPVIGGYELVSLAGGFFAAFAFPHSFLKKAHIRVDLVVEKLSPFTQRVLDKITRALGLLFILIAIYFLSKMSWSLAKTHTTSATLGIPVYPVTLGLIAGLVVQCFIFIYELLAKREGSHNE